MYTPDFYFLLLTFFPTLGLYAVFINFYSIVLVPKVFERVATTDIQRHIITWLVHGTSVYVSSVIVDNVLA